jgi:predicted transcriptional regulator
MSKIISHEEAVKKLREIVKDKGNQLEAAKFLDISPSVLSGILNGKDAISDSLARRMGYTRVYSFKPVQE